MSLPTRDPSATSSKVNQLHQPPSPSHILLATCPRLLITHSTYPICLQTAPRWPMSITRPSPLRCHDAVANCSRLGILHTIFFHRFFPSLTPRTREVLDLTLPYVDDDELETMIDQRASALERQLDAQRTSGSAGNGGGRGQLAVQFFEKRRRKAWLSRGDEEVCWECWTIKVTVAEPRTESGEPFLHPNQLGATPCRSNM